MKIPAVKYMRDFYPEDMQVRDWIEQHWRRVSLRAGFQPWDGPILEHLDLYTRKSGAEIVNQLYTLTDRGGRELAIRPEMTPTLARMITERQASLPRPIKWFCIARMCRYERGQRGRLREFWQWNADVLGVEDPVADAEVISLALDGLQALGLTDAEIEVRVNSRSLLAALLAGLGVPQDRHADVYAVTDKRGKIPAEELAKLYQSLGLPEPVLERILEVNQCESLADVGRFAQARGVTGHERELEKLEDLFELLSCLGKSAYCRFDIGIVRGLAYYTGPVFEVYDKAVDRRAICGGGRYDQLLEQLGSAPLPAVGFGLGDVVLGDLLKELSKLPSPPPAVEYHFVALEPDRLADAVRLAQTLRQKGVPADFAMRAGNLSKALKRAGNAGVRHVVLVGGREWADGTLRVRDMISGSEAEIPIESL